MLISLSEGDFMRYVSRNSESLISVEQVVDNLPNYTFKGQSFSPFILEILMKK